MTASTWGGARKGAGRPRTHRPPHADAHVRLDEPTAAQLAAAWGGDLPAALRGTAEAWVALEREALARLQGQFTAAELRACLDVANGLLLVEGFLGEHLAADLADHGDPAYAALAGRVATLHRFDRAVLELWCRRWWAAGTDEEQQRVWLELRR